MKTIEKFLKELPTGIEILDFVDINKINVNDAFNSIYEMIDENGGFDVEITYYSNAIEYLKENDPSLKESLDLAIAYGFKIEYISSEILASILASDKARKNFEKLRGEIDAFFGCKSCVYYVNRTYKFDFLKN
jgi:hypothetical protein